MSALRHYWNDTPLTPTGHPPLKGVGKSWLPLEGELSRALA